MLSNQVRENNLKELKMKLSQLDALNKISFDLTCTTDLDVLLSKKRGELFPNGYFCL